MLERLWDTSTLWGRRVGYGWVMAESTISCMKRTLGEHVSARKLANMGREMLIKAAHYNRSIG